MKKRTKGCLIALVALPIALFIGVCIVLKCCAATGEPAPLYMVDRTEGWEPSFPATAMTSVCILDANEGSFEAWKALLVPRPVEPLGQVEEAQVETYAERALRDAFGEAYLDMGGRSATVSESSSGSAWIYQNGPVLVAFDKATGEVWACVDMRLQPHIEVRDTTSVRYTCQMEKLNREELLRFGSAASELPAHLRPDTAHIELPLDAQGAYELGEWTAVEICRKQPAKVGRTGGALYIYYCEASDAYFIVNDTFIQALAREDGEQLLLWFYSFWSDASKKVRSR